MEHSGTTQFSNGDTDEIAFTSRNEMHLAVWEGESRVRLYNYGYEDTFRERVGRFLHNGITDLWKQGHLFDLKVHISGEVFKCHRTVLASVSELFKSQLMAESPSKGVSVVTLDGQLVTPRLFQHLLELVYEGKDIVRDESPLFDIMKAVTYLKVRALEWRILSLLTAEITERTCMKIWDWAETNNIPTLASKAKGVTLTHFQVLRHTEEFLHIPAERLIMILGHELLQYRCEDDILEAILEWVRFDKEDRKQHLKELLPYVCFPYLSTRYLNDLRKDELIGLKTEFAPFIDEALTYHLASLQPGGKKIQMQVLKRQAHTFKRLVPGQRRVVMLIGGAVVEGEPLTTVVACYLDMSHPLSRYGQMIQFSIASLPHALGLHFASSTWKHDVYVSGGSKAPESLIVYKPYENTWHCLDPLPVGRQNHAMVPVDGRLYLLGGTTTSGSRHRVLAEISEYNTETGEWREAGELCVAVEAAPAVTLSDKIYVLGGREESGRGSQVIQCVDMKTGRCRVAGELPVPVWDARAIVLGKNIILVCPDGSVFKIYEKRKQTSPEDTVTSEDTVSAMYASQLSFTENETFDTDMADLSDQFESSWSVLTTGKPGQLKTRAEPKLSPPNAMGSQTDADTKNDKPRKETAPTTPHKEGDQRGEQKGAEEGERPREERGEAEGEEEEGEIKELIQEALEECPESPRKGTATREGVTGTSLADGTSSNKIDINSGEEDKDIQPEEEEEEEEDDDKKESKLSLDDRKTGEPTWQPRTSAEAESKHKLDDRKTGEPVWQPRTASAEAASRQPACDDLGIERIATMEKRRDFGLFIRKVDVMVVGGQAENGNFLDDIVRIHVQTGQVRKSELKLSIPLSGMQVESTVIHQNFLMQYFDATSCFY